MRLATNSQRSSADGRARSRKQTVNEDQGHDPRSRHRLQRISRETRRTASRSRFSACAKTRYLCSASRGPFGPYITGKAGHRREIRAQEWRPVPATGFRSVWRQRQAACRTHGRGDRDPAIMLERGALLVRRQLLSVRRCPHCTEAVLRTGSANLDGILESVWHRSGRSPRRWRLSDPLQSLPVAREYTGQYRAAAAKHGENPYVILMRDAAIAGSGEETLAQSGPIVAARRQYYDLGVHTEDEYLKDVKRADDPALRSYVLVMPVCRLGFASNARRPSCRDPSAGSLPGVL